MPEFSIVIPLYNEERRLPKTAGLIFDFFRNQNRPVEIIFVNDGSNDRTVEILDEYKKDQEFRVVSYDENRGKGYAVKQGALAAEGDWVIFFDIDLATPLAEFHRLLEARQPEDKIIIGSRRLEKSQINKSESNIRTFLGHGFTKISNILVPGIKDFTCGFKGFSREAAQKIFPVAQIDRWGFDTELLYIAKLKNLPVKQIPVQWAHDGDSRVKVFSAIISSLRELFQMKGNQIKGLYK
jgi:dolichyl-phosphate beta-glucosyltransferase